ncbi:MAG: SDR family NAD(P)-dependent oxidoreductase [Myxococcales bacterium FL481]|nr:MAG: SDR family NAD(P)-dependent oxidoreductase [Myxococcales bacterium FL481]
MQATTVRLRDVPSQHRDLHGKTVVFSGGTDGMGRVAVEKLAKMGADVVLLARNEVKSQATVEEINQLSDGGRARYVRCDLADLASVRACADEILTRCSRIDVLVNCAGANFNERRLNEDGMELSWVVNHLGGFLLTQLLLERLKDSAPAKIVHLSSATEKYGHIHLEDLQLERSWGTLKAYAQAKLALNMCTIRLAQELEGTGVTVNALNPGFIQTKIGKGHGLSRWQQVFARVYGFFSAEPIEVGADRIITLTIAPQYDGVSGEFVYEDHVKTPNPEALDEELVERVWDISMSQVGLRAVTSI